MNLASHDKQRVGVFIDSQNLYHSARNLFNARVNYEAIIDWVVGERDLIRAFAYVIKSTGVDGVDNEEAEEMSGEEKFFEALEEIGIEIRLKDLQVFHTGQKKADWDVGIAVDMIRMVEKLDTMILMSGDGDFVELVKYLRSRGVRVEVVGFEKTMSAKLIEEADFVYDLQEHAREFLIGGRGRVVSRRGRVTGAATTVTAKRNSTEVLPSRTNTGVNRYDVPVRQDGSFPSSNELRRDVNYPSFLRKKSEGPVSGVVDEKIYKRRVAPKVYKPRVPGRAAPVKKSNYGMENVFGNKPKKRTSGNGMGTSSGGANSFFKF